MAENSGSRQVSSGKYRMNKGVVVRKKSVPYAS